MRIYYILIDGSVYYQNEKDGFFRTKTNNTLFSKLPKETHMTTSSLISAEYMSLSVKIENYPNNPYFKERIIELEALYPEYCI